MILSTEPVILEDEGKLVLRAPDMPDISVPLKAPEVTIDNLLEVQVWDDLLTGIDLGPEVSAWLSQYLEGTEEITLLFVCAAAVVDMFVDISSSVGVGEFRLVAKGSRPRKLDDKVMPRGEAFDFEPQTGFTDNFPFHLISVASLEDLNSRLSHDAQMKNFRPNIIVRGCEPFGEDTWQKIAIGSRIFHVVSLCPRCQARLPLIFPHLKIK